MSALIDAATIGDVSKVRKLLQEGANPNTVDQNGKTPLHVVCQFYGRKHLENEAVQARVLEIVQVLLEHGADVNAKEYEDWCTPLYYYLWSPKIVALLIKSGAQVNSNTSWGHVPLHCVENPEVAVMLIEHGCHVNEPNWRGKTPLDVAQNKEIERILRENGATE